MRLEKLEGRVLAAVRNLGLVRESRGEGNRLIVELIDPERNRPELVKAVVEAGGRILEVSEQQHPLEEVYLRLIREEAGSDS